MPINVALVDEDGRKLVYIGEPVGAPIHRALAKAVGPRSPWASTIDPYGDTTFNYLQAGLLREEWARLIEEADDETTKELLLQIDGILQRCISERLYVKFYGD